MNATANPYNPDLPWVACAPFRTPADFDAAPVQFRFQQALPCTPAQLFEVFEDPDAWSRWATGIGSVTWTSPPPYAVGTTRTVRFWGGMEVYERFTGWEPGKHMAFTFLGTSELVWTAFGERYDVEATPGGCRLTWRISYAPGGGFARVHPLVRPLMHLNLRSYLWRLKRYVGRRFS